VTGSAIAGILLVLLAGAMNGSFAAPMKWTREWAWENTWFAWSSIALLFFPVLLAFATVPSLGDIYAQANPRVLVLVLASGAAWGVSQVLFGLGISRAGVALGFAIVVGLAAAVGSLLPLLISPAASGQGTRGAIGGVAVVLVGVGLCAYAGSSKEPSGRAAKAALSGILLCVAAGIGGAMINVGMVWGAPLTDAAQARGAAAVNQTNAVWLPLLAAGFIATSVYCFALLSRNGTWSRFRDPALRRYWLLALAMAICWFGSVELYGIAAAGLGPLGPVLGWPMFLSASIITANIWGIATGEWKQAAAGARRLMLAGVSVLVAAIFVIGIAGKV